MSAEATLSHHEFDTFTRMLEDNVGLYLGKEKEYLILRKQNTLYSVADLLIGGIPLAVDFTTGNIYRPVPRSFKYELIKE